MNMDSGGSSLSTYVLTGLALVGIAMGGAGLYLGVNARGGDSAQDDRLSELEQKVDRLNGASEELQGQIRGLYSSTRTSLDGLAGDINALRDELKPKAPVAAAAPAATADAADGGGASGTYTIRPGDLLGKVAKTAGTTVDAILKVNPGLNPNRLKVGQTINLP